MALNSLVLDTSGYSAFFRGHPLVVDALRHVQSILLPTIVVGEVLAGFEAGSRRPQNRHMLAEFQHSPRVRTIPVTQETAERYARIYAYLRSVGRPIPTNDMWIAAVTMEHGSVLLTADGHFLDLPQIVVQHFVPGG
jgi:tRNA(fMet)-specific endonuclease VapC